MWIGSWAVNEVQLYKNKLINASAESLYYFCRLFHLHNVPSLIFNAIYIYCVIGMFQWFQSFSSGISMIGVLSWEYSIHTSIINPRRTKYKMDSIKATYLTYITRVVLNKWLFADCRHPCFLLHLIWASLTNSHWQIFSYSSFLNRTSLRRSFRGQKGGDISHVHHTNWGRLGRYHIKKDC